GVLLFFFQAEDGIRDWSVTGVQTCALPISLLRVRWRAEDPWPCSSARRRPRRRWRRAARSTCRQTRSTSLARRRGTRRRTAGRRSEERRVGKEGRSRGWPEKRNKKAREAGA